MQEEQISSVNKLRHNRWVATILARKKHSRFSFLYKYASVSYYASNKIMGGTKHMLSLTVSERTILQRKIFLWQMGQKIRTSPKRKLVTYADQTDSLIRSCAEAERMRKICCGSFNSNRSRCSSCSSQICSSDAVHGDHASAAGSSS